MKNHNFFLILALATITLHTACKKENNQDPVLALNTNLELPPGSFQVDPDTALVDETIDILDTGGGATSPLNPSGQMNMSISFNAPGGNVVAGGMRFGNAGPINFVPVPDAQGQTNGTMNIPFSVSPSTCNNLSRVCHDIKCYEFAMTSDGKITRSNIRDVALMCGNCDEPSCQDLIDPPCPPGPSEGSVTFGNESFSGFAACVDAAFGNGQDINVAGNNYVLIIGSVPSSGTANLSDEFYNTGTSCMPNCQPYAQISDINGNSWFATSGTVQRNGNTVTFSATMENILTGDTRSASGSVSCG